MPVSKDSGFKEKQPRFKVKFKLNKLDLTHFSWTELKWTELPRTEPSWLLRLVFDQHVKKSMTSPQVHQLFVNLNVNRPFYPHQPFLTSESETDRAGQRAGSETKREQESCAVNMQEQESAREREKARGTRCERSRARWKSLAIIPCNSRAKPSFSSSNWASLGSKAICNQRALRSGVAVERGAPLIKPPFPSSLPRWHFCVGASRLAHHTPTAGEKYQEYEC